MFRESRMLAGVLLVTLPTVMFGGLTLLTQLVGGAPGYSTTRSDKVSGELGTRTLVST